MPQERNRQTLRRVFEEVFNQGRVDLVAQLCVPGLVFHSPTLQGPGHGPEALTRFALELRGGFPDLRIRVEDLFASDDKVVVRWRTTRQTHLGWYQGVPPTGRRIAMTGIDIARLEDARVAEIWLEIDALGGVRQMGVLPPADGSTPRRVGAMLSGMARLAVLEARHARTKPKGEQRP